MTSSPSPRIRRLGLRRPGRWRGLERRQGDAGGGQAGLRGRRDGQGRALRHGGRRRDWCALAEDRGPTPRPRRPVRNRSLLASAEGRRCGPPGRRSGPEELRRPSWLPPPSARVLDAHVEGAGQRIAERLGDARQVAHRQPALVELTGLQLLEDDLLQGHVDGLALRVGAQGAREAASTASQIMIDCRLLRLGLDTGVAEVGLRQALGVAELHVLVEEVLEHRGPVVHVHEVGHPLRDPLPPCDLHALDDVGEDGVGGDVGLEVVVGVGPALLVLDVVLGLHRLAQVVVVGADAGQEAIGADGVGGGLGEVGHRQAVLPGAWGALGDVLEEVAVHVAEVDQLPAADGADQGRHRPHQHQRQHRRDRAGRQGPEEARLLETELLDGDAAVGHQEQRPVGQHADHAGRHPPSQTELWRRLGSRKLAAVRPWARTTTIRKRSTGTSRSDMKAAITAAVWPTRRSITQAQSMGSVAVGNQSAGKGDRSRKALPNSVPARRVPNSTACVRASGPSGGEPRRKPLSSEAPRMTARA